MTTRVALVVTSAALSAGLSGVAGCAADGTRSDAPATVAPATTGPTTTRAVQDNILWEHRLLAVFADEERDDRLDEQRRALGPGVQALRDRDVRVVEIVGADPLREALEVPRGGFHVVLVGKDRGVKLRSTTVVSLERITSLIDTMPMRQRELGERGR